MKPNTQNNINFSNRVRQFMEDIDAEAQRRADNILRDITEGRTSVTEEIKRRGGT